MSIHETFELDHLDWNPVDKKKEDFASPLLWSGLDAWIDTDTLLLWENKP